MWLQPETHRRIRFPTELLDKRGRAPHHLASTWVDERRVQAVKVNIRSLDFPLRGTLTVSFGSPSSSWAGHQAKKRAGPHQAWRGGGGGGGGGVQMGRSLASLQGPGPPETTLPLSYQVISLTHFTGSAAHRAPHLIWGGWGGGVQRARRNLIFARRIV